MTIKGYRKNGGVNSENGKGEGRRMQREGMGEAEGWG
jgi:hypothetical protein